jgi:hypothetical protein
MVDLNLVPEILEGNDLRFVASRCRNILAECEWSEQKKKRAQKEHHLVDSFQRGEGFSSFVKEGL